VLPLTLRAESDASDGVVKLAADVTAIEDCAASLWLRIADVPGGVASLKTAPASVAHRDASGARLFTTELREVLVSRANASLPCPVVGCVKEIKDVAAALAHSAYHALHTPEKVQHPEMCPLCFGPASGCPPFLVKGSSLQPRIVCSAYAPSASRNDPTYGAKFSAASLKKSTRPAPSTNHPIVCPACNPDLAEGEHQIISVAATKRNKKSIRPAVWS
jgi:hypothetical protein